MRCILTAQLSMPMDGSVVYVFFSILSSLFSDLPFWPSPKIRRVRWLHTNDPHASVQNTKMCTTTSLSTPFCASCDSVWREGEKHVGPCVQKMHRKPNATNTQGARTTKHLFWYVHLGSITRIGKPVLGALLVNNHRKREDNNDDDRRR